ncbi:MAG: Dph6-related ATP pyrophosphatase [Planctomycetota bacterium]
MQKVWLCWSSGKDAAWALHLAREDPDLEISALLTTVTRDYARVSMHAVREQLVTAQAAALGLPLEIAYIPAKCSNEDYEAAMRSALAKARDEGVTGMIFGDIFLEDVRRYREEKLAGTGIAPLFPLWGLDTAALAREIIESGLEAVITCLDPRKMPRELAGRRFDADFLAALPEGVDPCGENGEFHTFCFAGPMFSCPVSVTIGETVERDGFVFTDVTPAE